LKITNFRHIYKKLLIVEKNYFFTIKEIFREDALQRFKAMHGISTTDISQLIKNAIKKSYGRFK